MTMGSTTVNISLPYRVFFIAIGCLTFVSMASSSPALAGDFLGGLNEVLSQTNRVMQQGQRFQQEMRRQEAIERRRQAQEARERQRQEAIERRRQEAERQRRIYENMTPEQRAEYQKEEAKKNALAAGLLMWGIGAAFSNGGGSSASNDPCAQSPYIPVCTWDPND